MRSTARSVRAAAALVLAGCAASHTGGPEDLATLDGGGSVEVVWSIPEEEQPPSLDGAAGVLQAAALNRFQIGVGLYVTGTRIVYEGSLALENRAPLDVVATWTTLPSFYLVGVTFEAGVHELELYAGSPMRRAGVWQDRLWATLPAESLPSNGLGTAWLDVQASTGDELLGRCTSCMTILSEPPVDDIVLHADQIDPEYAAIVDFGVEAELHRIAPDAFTPEVLRRVWKTMGDETAESVADELIEVAPDTWEREHLDQTYLRCKEGGSRLVDYRTTWVLRPHAPERSGVRAIEVFDAGPCEAFDYGGAS